MKRVLLATLLFACSTERTAPAPQPAPVAAPVAATEPSKVIALDAGPSIYDLETPMTYAA